MDAREEIVAMIQATAERVREGDYVLLIFSDGRQILAECAKKPKSVPTRINKRTYSTAPLIGLQYGRVLELGQKEFKVLPEGEDLMPEISPLIIGDGTSSSNTNATTVSTVDQTRDNRNIIDDNTSQGLDHHSLHKMIQDGTDGAIIVQQIIENSSTFEQKTDFSRQKYIAKKQQKYQQRCRIVRCTAASMCEYMYLKDFKRQMCFRGDTLAQVLSYADICAGCQTIVYDDLQGLVTCAVAERMGGYGRLFSIYEGQQPTTEDMQVKFNLSFAERAVIKHVHAGDIFGEPPVDEDLEKIDRESIDWPCPLQPHTKRYIDEMEKEKDRRKFLSKRSARFARKLTRHTPMEAYQWLGERKSDSIILVTRYDPTKTLMALLPFLNPSCPFVIFCEYAEPLTECFRKLQDEMLAINIRFSDTWAREYQVLPGRTHPSMNMSQSGGFLLTGIKLDEKHGKNELSEELLKEIREEMGPRRKRNKCAPKSSETVKRQKTGD